MANQVEQRITDWVQNEFLFGDRILHSLEWVNTGRVPQDEVSPLQRQGEIYYRRYGVSRGIRGFEIHRAGLVLAGYPPRRWNFDISWKQVTYHVLSQQGDVKYYTVWWGGAIEWSMCECVDYREGRRKCKHLYAVMFFRSDQWFHNADPGGKFRRKTKGELILRLPFAMTELEQLDDLDVSIKIKINQLSQ